jgi:hypothetical protein
MEIEQVSPVNTFFSCVLTISLVESLTYCDALILIINSDPSP